MLNSSLVLFTWVQSLILVPLDLITLIVRKVEPQGKVVQGKCGGKQHLLGQGMKQHDEIIQLRASYEGFPIASKQRAHTCQSDQDLGVGWVGWREADVFISLLQQASLIANMHSKILKKLKLFPAWPWTISSEALLV